MGAIECRSLVNQIVDKFGVLEKKVQLNTFQQTMCSLGEDHFIQAHVITRSISCYDLSRASIQLKLFCMHRDIGCIERDH